MATIPISPNRIEILTALRSFLLRVLPDGVDVVIAVENRVPEPVSPNFAIMSPIRFVRLTTNVDSYDDVKFTGAIAPAPAAFTGSIAPAAPIPGGQGSGVLTVTVVATGTVLSGGALSGTKVAAGTVITGQISGAPGGIGVYSVNLSQTTPATAIAQSCGLMTVTEMLNSQILVGATVFGVDLLDDTIVTALGTGTGGVGTYVVSKSQTIGSETLSAGAKVMRQDSKVTVQIDFHSINGSSADMAQTVSTTFRDAFAAKFFSALAPPQNSVAPFYADDPRLMPFLNENQQYEWRWVAEADMQANQIVRVPQQFADLATVELVSVDAEWPP